MTDQDSTGWDGLLAAVVTRWLRGRVIRSGGVLHSMLMTASIGGFRLSVTTVRRLEWRVAFRDQLTDVGDNSPRRASVLASDRLR